MLIPKLRNYAVILPAFPLDPEENLDRTTENNGDFTILLEALRQGESKTTAANQNNLRVISKNSRLYLINGILPCGA